MNVYVDDFFFLFSTEKKKTFVKKKKEKMTRIEKKCYIEVEWSLYYIEEKKIGLRPWGTMPYILASYRLRSAC